MDFETIDLKWQNMLAGIKAQVSFIQKSPQVIYEEIKSKLRLEKAPGKVYLTGCGDSWYCGIATRFAFEEWAQISTEAAQAMDFSRYLVHTAPKDAILIAVSNSGRLARTIESVIQAKKAGITTIGTTSNMEVGLSQEADHVIDLMYSERRFAPGTSSYMASMVVEYCLAIYFAELKGLFDPQQVKNKLDSIAALASPMEKTIEANLEVMESLVRESSIKNQCIFIGAGPNYGTAFFSMAKVIEATRTPAVGQQMEEWAHIQYFFTNQNTLTFLIAPPGRSVNRAREQMVAVKAMGSKCIAICHPDDQQTAAGADVVAPVFGDVDEVLSPILYCVPAEVFAFHHAAHHNLAMLGFDDPKVKEVNWRQIFDSEIER